MNGFEPEFFVDSQQGNLLRIGFSASGAGFRCRSRVVTVRVDENWDIGVRAQSSLDLPSAFRVILDLRRSRDSPDSLTFDIGELIPSGEVNPDSMVDLEPELTGVLQRAFFEAHGWPAGRRFEIDAGGSSSVPFLRQKPVKQVYEGGRRSWRGAVSSKSITIAAALLLGVGLVGYGLLVPRTSQNTLQAADGSDYSELRARIQKEIVAAANQKNTPYGLEGQNVTIATLKAMGLDPGKANTGCLVGVK